MLEPRLTVLRPYFSAEQVAHFANFIETAPEEELYRTSPQRYEAQSGLSRRQAIDLFLYAAHAGILDLLWGVICPACASFIPLPLGLRAVHSNIDCHY